MSGTRPRARAVGGRERAHAVLGHAGARIGAHAGEELLEDGAAFEGLRVGRGAPAEKRRVLRDARKAGRARIGKARLVARDGGAEREEPAEKGREAERPRIETDAGV